MDPAHGVAISSFDIFLEMSIRAIRITGKGDISHYIDSVSIDSIDYSTGTGVSKSKSDTKPLVLSREELNCFKEHSPLPDRLDTHTAPGQIDISETFMIPA